MRPIDLILSVMPELAPAYSTAEHERAAARLAMDLPDDSPEQTACDEADAEDRMYRAGIASGKIKGVR